MQLSTLGSTLYRLTWKTWAMPSGRMLVRQRASAHRTSGTDATGAGWPTPTTRDWKGGANPNVDVPLNALLGRVVWLAGWPTATANDATGSTHQYGPGKSVMLKLAGAAKTASAAPEASGVFRKYLDALPEAQPARFTASGQMLTGSAAGMESGLSLIHI